MRACRCTIAAPAAAAPSADSAISADVTGKWTGGVDGSPVYVIFKQDGPKLSGSAGPVELNPKMLGIADVGANSMSLSSAPVTVRPGQKFKLAVGGDGFTSGMTQLEVMTPFIKRTSDFTWSQDSVSAIYEVATNAAGQSAVIV